MKLFKLIFATPTTQPGSVNVVNATLDVTVALAVNDAIRHPTDGNSGAEASRIYTVASQIKSIADDGGDLSDLQAVAAAVENKMAAGKDKDSAIFYTNLAFTLIRSYFGVGNGALIPPDKFPIERALVSELAQVAMDSASPYRTAQGLPLPS